MTARRIELTIDNRERGLIATLTPMIETAKLPAAEVRALDIGDIQFIRDGELYIVIERKTYADFVSSMSDGRYREQKARLMSEREKAAAAGRSLRLFYLFEGQLTPTLSKTYPAGRASFTETSIISAMSRAAIKDAFYIMQLPSADATAKWIHGLYEKLSESPDEFEGGAAAVEAAGGYASLTAARKKDNVTPEVAYRAMLSTIPGVSAKASDAIASVWPTMPALCTHLASDGTATLADVKVGAKRLGKTVADRIRTMLSIPELATPTPTKKTKKKT